MRKSGGGTFSSPKKIRVAPAGAIAYAELTKTPRKGASNLQKY